MSFDLEQELIRRNISVREILEEYSNGEKVSVICKNHKINPDQLRFILRYNENEEINKKRKAQLEDVEAKKERFKEALALVEGERNPFSNWKNKNQEILENKLDVNEVIERYKSGISLDNIRILYRLSEKQLNDIIDKKVTPEIKNIREDSRKRFQNYGNMENRTERRSEYKTNLTKKEARDNVQKAINLVEGNDELSL